MSLGVFFDVMFCVVKEIRQAIAACQNIGELHQVSPCFTGLVTFISVLSLWGGNSELMECSHSWWLTNFWLACSCSAHWASACKGLKKLKALLIRRPQLKPVGRPVILIRGGECRIFVILNNRSVVVSFVVLSVNFGIREHFNVIATHFTVFHLDYFLIYTRFLNSRIRGEFRKQCRCES